MKAIIANGYGGPEVLSVSDQPEPQPEPNQVKIRVHFANISKADTMMRTGKPLIGRLFTGLIKPKNPITGTGYAGVVEDIGAQVSDFKIGDQVYGESIEHFSAHAEYLCLDSHSIVRKLPKGVSLPQAAALCDGALTAYNFLFKLGKLKSGERILINGASGNVGSTAVQLAKIAGAHVTAVCSQANMDMVKRLGADHVIAYDVENIDYSQPQYHMIFDAVGTLCIKQASSALTENGSFLCPVLSAHLLFKVLSSKILGKKRFLFSATGLLPHDLLNTYLSEMEPYLSSGKLQVVIDKSLAPEEIRHAHEYVDTNRKKGSLLLDFIK